ncbi:MAG: endopeptidase La [Gammaproteobacteria bacterium]|nr:endopeptidase La [Gammaproteobacteria bacterium]
MNEEVEPEVVNEIARSTDVLPSNLYILPVSKKPIFPGQIIPVVIDFTVWESTFKAIHKEDMGYLGLLYISDIEMNDSTVNDMSEIGTVCRIHQLERQENQVHMVVSGVQRLQIISWVSRDKPFTAQVRYFPETTTPRSNQIKAYTTAIFNTIKELLPLNPMYGEELKLFLNNFGTADPAKLADFGASMTTADAPELQDILNTIELAPRMEKTLVLLRKEVEIAKVQSDIRTHIESELSQHQRDNLLREQLKYIQKELGISKDDREAEIETFRDRLEKLVVPDHASKKIDEEMEKMAILERGSPEYTVTRNYLDWLTSIPWGLCSEDRLELNTAREILDADHEGLDEAKQRILEFIAVGRMRGVISGSIILFVGPPGVGKTSLGRSIANALARKFYRFSLGGMRDEAEIKGHRRTYIGSMPGKFVQALRECGTSNPVIMLDEIDKVGASYRGDPAHALLEVLDPEQNKEYLDHYLDVRIDLSNVLFICTANQLDTIPAPLLDRMEEIRLSGYLTDEKVAIARKHLLPKQITSAGLKKRGQLRIDSNAIRKIIDEYAREAGVRRLEKMIGTIVRKSVMQLLDGHQPPVHVKAADLEEYLGTARFGKENLSVGVGVARGLAWTALGGSTLDIEATRAHEFSRGFRLTGHLGDIMKESAEIAYSYVIGNAESLTVDHHFFETSMIHLHVPAGATPKDGPSAGITIASALVSLALGRKIRGNLAMTGELSLTGQVLPVGGIREKIVAARRMKIRNIILPRQNQGDYHELPDYIRDRLKIEFVSHYQEVLQLIF